MKTSPLLAAAAFAALAAAAAAADAPANWTANCAACHGADGAGHTKAGRIARVKNMTDAAYQATFTDEQAANQIKNGFKDPTGKERMKAFGDTLAPDEINALVAYVRSLKK
jgi:cytochrome c553